jgi:hypothetical protein
MLEFSPILADGDDIGKIIAGIVIFVIWGIGALANLAKKQNAQAQQQREAMERAMMAQMEEARRRAAAAQAQGAREQTSPATRPPPVPPMRSVGMPPPPPRAPQAARRTAVDARQAQMQAQRQQRAAKKQQRRQPQAPPPIPTPPPQSFESGAPGVFASDPSPASVAASSTRRQGTGPQAGRTTRRLNSQTLRQQFILTELLQPPLALRDRPPGI